MTHSQHTHDPLNPSQSLRGRLGKEKKNKQRKTTLTSARACMKQHITSLFLLLFIEENQWSFTRWCLPLSVTSVFFYATSGPLLLCLSEWKETLTVFPFEVLCSPLSSPHSKINCNESVAVRMLHESHSHGWLDALIVFKIKFPKKWKYKLCWWWWKKCWRFTHRAAKVLSLDKCHNVIF